MSISTQFKDYRKNLLALKKPYRTEVRCDKNRQYVYHTDGENIVGCIIERTGSFREIMINPRMPQP